MFEAGKNACLTLLVLTTCSLAGAQMVVHAVSGTVKSIDAKAKRMSVAVEEGTSGTFAMQSKSEVPLDFDPDLRGDAVDATKFDGVGDFAVVYFYGYGDSRTAVAVKDLGKSGLEKTTGTIAEFDKHSRAMTIHTSDGKTEEFKVNDTAVVDTGLGLESGRRYSPHKGATVRVTASNAGGKNVALFIRSRR